MKVWKKISNLNRTIVPFFSLCNSTLGFFFLRSKTFLPLQLACRSRQHDMAFSSCFVCASSWLLVFGIWWFFLFFISSGAEAWSNYRATQNGGRIWWQKWGFRRVWIYIAVLFRMIKPSLETLDLWAAIVVVSSLTFAAEVVRWFVGSGCVWRKMAAVGAGNCSQSKRFKGNEGESTICLCMLVVGMSSSTWSMKRTMSETRSPRLTRSQADEVVEDSKLGG